MKISRRKRKYICQPKEVIRAGPIFNQTQSNTANRRTSRKAKYGKKNFTLDWLSQNKVTSAPETLKKDSLSRGPGAGGAKKSPQRQQEGRSSPGSSCRSHGDPHVGHPRARASRRRRRDRRGFVVFSIPTEAFRPARRTAQSRAIFRARSRSAEKESGVSGLLGRSRVRVSDGYAASYAFFRSHSVRNFIEIIRILIGDLRFRRPMSISRAKFEEAIKVIYLSYRNFLF